MKHKRAFAILVAILVAVVPVASGAPTSAISFDPKGQVSSVDNILQLGQSEQVTIVFNNTAGADVTDVGSTIQYIKIAAADLNPNRTIIDTGVDASWKIFTPGNPPTLRTSGKLVWGVDASLDTAAIYSPYSTSDTVYMYTWALGKPNSTLNAYTDPKQIDPAQGGDKNLRVLRPREALNLTITIKCESFDGNSYAGDSRIWFFFRASEAAYASGSYPTDITTIDPAYEPATSLNRVNLYYSTIPRTAGGPFWLPLHNSYDPYDSDIGTGHSFSQFSWTRNPTTTAFAKANKLVHQKPVESPTPCIHIVKSGPPTAQVDQTITYNYNVTNCGNVPLSSVTLTDNVTGTPIYVNGDTDNDNKLDTTETWHYTATYTVKTTDRNPLNNTATVTGTYDSTKVTDSDTLSVPITLPPQACIHIVKSGPATAEVNQTITYNYNVTNCGYVALSSVTLTDNVTGTPIYVNGDTDNDNKLDTTEIWHYTATYTVTYTDYTDRNPLNNTATVTGTYDSTKVTDSDTFSAPIIPTGQPTVFSFHICGTKFDDLNRNGKYDVEAEPGIGLLLNGVWVEPGVNVTLLGPDKTTKATVYYPELSYPPPEDVHPDVLMTGENGLTGSYCFNLLVGLAGAGRTYTFYIRIDELPGRVPTTPTLIGPITLVAGVDEESLNNNFGNVLPPCKWCTKSAVLSQVTQNVGVCCATPDIIVDLRLGSHTVDERRVGTDRPATGSIQAAVDYIIANGDVNHDGALFIGVTAKDCGTDTVGSGPCTGQSGRAPYGGGAENVVITNTRSERLNVFGCSVTLQAEDPGKPVISIVNSKGKVTVLDVHVTGSNVAGYLIQNNSDLVVVKNARAMNSAVGYLIKDDKVEITGSPEISGNGVGLQIVGNSIILRTNKVLSNTGVGVDIQGNNNAVGDEDVEGNGGHGIVVKGGSNEIKGNDVFLNGGDGINIAGNNNPITSNDVGDKAMGNTGDGIHVQGNGNTLDGNKAFGNGGDGIEAAGNNNIIKRSSVGDLNKGNGGDGIRVAGYGNKLQENNVYANTGDGIDISDGTFASPNVIYKNKVGDRGKGNGGNGIKVAGTGNGKSNPIEIDSNTVKSNGLVGIQVTGSGHQLKNNVSGGSLADDNGDCEFDVAIGNFNATGNKANGLAIPGISGSPFPTGCIGTP